MYNLTDNQKNLAKWLVQNVKDGNLEEVFTVELCPANRTIDENSDFVSPFQWSPDDLADIYEVKPLSYKGTQEDWKSKNITQLSLQALVNNDLLFSQVARPAEDSTSTMGSGGAVIVFTMPSNEILKYSLTGNIYKAVDSDFNSPDISFVNYLTPLANPSGFDEALKKRCFPILATGGSDPKLWDSAVRTAGVILEERLRDVGSITEPNRVGQGLVNDIFKKNGTLASKFSVDSERDGYRDLYSGIVGVFRNPSAHRFIDHSPEEGGALLVFINLLLKKLEDLR